MNYRLPLFLFVFVLFLLITPAVVLYSQGYRFDFQNLKLVKTGAIFVKTIPLGATVSLNEKKIGSVSPIWGTKFIQNLLPRTYAIEISKNGYGRWKKNVNVQATKTAEFKQVLLIPEKPSQKLIQENVETVTFFYPATLVGMTKNPKEKMLVFSIVDMEQPQSLKIYKFSNIPAIPDFSLKAEVEDFTPDKIILKVFKQSPKELAQRFMVNLETMVITSIPFPDNGSNPVHVFFDPSGRQGLVILSGNVLSYLEPQNPIKNTVISKNILAAWKISGKVMVLDGKAHKFFKLSSAETSSLALEFLINSPFLDTEKASRDRNRETYDFGLFVADDAILAHSDSFSVFFNQETKQWEPTPVSIHGAYATGDQKEVLAWNKNEVWGYWPQFSDKRGGWRYIARYLNQVKKAFLFGEQAPYAMIGTGQQIEIAELSLDGQPNVQSLPYQADDFFFNQKTGNLFYLSENNLYQTNLYR